jgi:3-methyladenine DNA glycosylase AlkD
MNVSEVLERLESEKSERGMAHWEKLGNGKAGLQSFGIGLTKLRKLGKEFGRDHELAQALWTSDVYDARVIALLIDEPRKLTREQAEQQVEQLAGGMLTHVFSSCDATLAKTPFAQELLVDWVRSDDPVRRDCGYGLLYEASKWKGRKAPDDKFFLEHIERIDQTIDDEPEGVRMSMGAALMGIGKKNLTLNKAALAVAQRVGPIEFTSASGNCDPFDVAKHLTSESLQKKLAEQS